MITSQAAASGCSELGWCVLLVANPAHLLLLLSAGSGITSPRYRCFATSSHLAMLRSDDVVFYHQCSSEGCYIPIKPRLTKIASEHAGLRVWLRLFKPNPTAKKRDGLSGRSSVSMSLYQESARKRQAFVCGPDGFMDNAKNRWFKWTQPQWLSSGSVCVPVVYRRGEATAVKCERLPVRR